MSPRSKVSEDIIEDTNEEITGDVATLSEEIRRLKQRERLAIRKTLSVEMELQSALTDRDLYRRKYLDAQSKLEQYSSTPYPVGVIEKLIDNQENRVIVRVLSGQMFVCKYDPQLQIKEGDTVALHQRSMAVMEILPPLVDTAITSMQIMEIPIENYEDIGGLNEVIREVREVVELSLSHPEVFQQFNISPPKGILLFGSPGTGKTLIAKAVANAADAKFFYIAAPEFVQKFIGEGARMVRDLFKTARDAETPVIIFIDEIDAIAAMRTTDSQSGEREVNRTLMQLLSEMDGFANNSLIRIIAATNRIDILDPAILRPGRFDRIIELPLPDEAARLAIFKIHSHQYPLSNINFTQLAQKTENLTGADIKAICTEAAMIALRERVDGKDRTALIQEDFMIALDRFQKKRERAPNEFVNPARLYA